MIGRACRVALPAYSGQQGNARQAAADGVEYLRPVDERDPNTVDFISGKTDAELEQCQRSSRHAATADVGPQRHQTQQ